jgi:hypothetical protein
LVETKGQGGKEVQMLGANMLGTKTRRRNRQATRRTAKPRPRIYVGRGVRRRAAATIFLRDTTQQVAARSRLGDWLGAVAMLGGMVGWGMILTLLGS